MVNCEITDISFNPCKGMDLAMDDNCFNDPGKGFHVVELTHLKTFESRVAGVAYRWKKDKQLYLNFCPFCGTQINQFIYAVATNKDA